VADWNQEPGWMSWRREKSSEPAQKQSSDHPVHNLDPILTMLPQLSMSYLY